MEEDILLIDKPVGITSFDVIRRLRKKLGIKKIGHAGTLDPLASGLMIIGAGKGTKKLTEYIKLSKEYIAEVLIGEKRTTGDMEGEVVESADVHDISEKEAQEVLKEMVGILLLPVPLYSAIKQDGQRLYKKARKGQEVGELPIREMGVIEAELLSVICADEKCVLKIKFYVGSGTYIRSLAEELGRRLGYPATLKSLRRTKIGDFTIEKARKI